MKESNVFIRLFLTFLLALSIKVRCEIYSSIATAFSVNLNYATSSRQFRVAPLKAASRNSTASQSCRQDKNEKQEESKRPIPAMPSELFQQLALSQLELLANSLPSASSVDQDGKKKSKIKSMALYLPQENVNTGQLEFLPAVIYPHPSAERVFIASHADSGVAPTLPRLLTKLPGFAAPNSLLPHYPMVSTSSGSAGVGVVEEVLCDLRSGAAALSVPLFWGSQTVGVLLVSPAVPPSSKSGKKASVWTKDDREQIARAASTLSMALNMDIERGNLEIENQKVQDALSDSLHQVKNPLQALRTFGKLLQRRVASTGVDSEHMVGTSLQLLELTQNLVEQSDRVVNLLAPMDSLVDSLGNNKSNSTERGGLLYLNPAPIASTEESQLVPWGQSNLQLLPWETDTLNFARLKTPRKANSAQRDSNDTMVKFPSLAKNENLRRGRNTTSTPSACAPASPPQSSPLVGVDDELEMGFILDVLDSILNTYKAIAEERGIIFSIIGLDNADELPGVLMQRKALQEAVSNILDNAFKYAVLSAPKQNLCDNHRNPTPMVRVRLLPNDEGELPPGVTIIVEDNGPGIPENEAEAVFQRGFRSPSISNLSQGTGIGLDISRCLVESMGGELKCLVGEKRSKWNFLDGAVFQVTLFRSSS